MKAIFPAIAMLLSSLVVSAQPTCEQKEAKLLTTMEVFSAAFLYNTYATIGSISDGFGNDAYSQATVDDLLNAQKKLIDNLVKLFGELDSGGYLTEKKYQDYARGGTEVLKGLKQQAQQMQDYANNKSQRRLDAYEVQRKKNWTLISRLMGVDE